MGAEVALESPVPDPKVTLMDRQSPWGIRIRSGTARDGASSVRDRRHPVTARARRTRQAPQAGQERQAPQAGQEQ